MMIVTLDLGGIFATDESESGAHENPPTNTNPPTGSEEGDVQKKDPAPKPVRQPDKTVKLTRLKLKGKKFSINSYLRGKYSSNNYVLQGCTTDGKYNYYIMERKSSNKCIIIKVNAKTQKKVKLSKPLLLDHANDVTYNPDAKLLYVVNSDGHPHRITAVDPKTLKIVKKYNLKIPKTLPGYPNKLGKKVIPAYVGIAYSKERKQYAVRISMKNDFILMDQNFRAIKYVKCNFKHPYVPQGFDCDADYIYFYESNDPKFNTIYVMNWDGMLVRKLKIKSKLEIESVFHNGKDFYATFYNGRYVSGRYKRDSYVYRISGM